MKKYMLVLGLIGLGSCNLFGANLPSAVATIRFERLTEGKGGVKCMMQFKQQPKAGDKDSFIGMVQSAASQCSGAIAYCQALNDFVEIEGSFQVSTSGAPTCALKVTGAKSEGVDLPGDRLRRIALELQLQSVSSGGLEALVAKVMGPGAEEQRVKAVAAFLSNQAQTGQRK